MSEVDESAERNERELSVADVLSLQNAVLQAVAVGQPLHQALGVLCREVERITGEGVCTVLLREGASLRHGAAPSLPASFIEGIDGKPIGPRAGSCGTAAYRGEAVEVTDIAHDTLWADYRALALAHGLHACWSSPIFARDGSVLGTFALYFSEVRGPSNAHRAAVLAATPLAAIAIERHRMDAAEHARVIELAQSNARIEELNRTLEARVAERTHDLDVRNQDLARAFEELQRTHARLFEARKLASLSHLVVGVAHELNTPIGNARVLATSLGERCLTLKKRIEGGGAQPLLLPGFVDDMLEGCELLARALETAADRVGRFKSVAVDHAASPRRTFVLREVVEDVLALFEPAARRAGCTLDADIAFDGMLDGYPGPTGQVLSSLIENALEHGIGSRTDGCVRIVVRQVPAGVELRVEDNGCGIAPETLVHVFDPFFTTRLAGGHSGLGLHVAHNLVSQLLGGRIEAIADLPRGAAFVVQLPLVAPRCA